MSQTLRTERHAPPRHESQPAAGMTSVLDFARAKATGRKITMVTSYDAWTARLLADTPVDCLLVGDSVMMVVHGEETTLGATPELMAIHTRAVARGAPGRLIVADMPFLSVRRGIGPAIDCAGLLVRGGAHAVKIEGARGHLDVVRHLVESGIPVMGHLGLTPQAVRALGGFKVQGREASAVARLDEDAAALEDAGAFGLVLECVPAPVGKSVTAGRRIPTIGIGAGPDCDGQVLVLNDLLGLHPGFHPRFARAFADGAGLVRGGVERYCRAVREGAFPSALEQF